MFGALLCLEILTMTCSSWNTYNDFPLSLPWPLVKQACGSTTCVCVRVWMGHETVTLTERFACSEQINHIPIYQCHLVYICVVYGQCEARMHAKECVSIYVKWANQSYTNISVSSYVYMLSLRPMRSTHACKSVCVYIREVSKSIIYQYISVP